MRRILEALDSTAFWVAVFLAGLVFVFSYSYSTNRTDVARNADTIRAQQQALAYLCETVRVIDAIYVQTAALDQLFVKDRTLSPSVRGLIRDRLRVLNTAHQELSNTRACLQIE